MFYLSQQSSLPLPSVKDSRIAQYFEFTYVMKFLTIAQATFVTVWIRCPRKFGPPKKWPSPGAIFPRKFGPSSEIWPPHVYGLENL